MVRMGYNLARDGSCQPWGSFEKKTTFIWFVCLLFTSAKQMTPKRSLK